MKHPEIRHQPNRKKTKPLLHFKVHKYLEHRGLSVQKSLDKLFGVEKKR